MARPTRKVSIADIQSYGPCSVYTQERLEELFAGRESMSMDEILATNIPPDHKLDCILRVGLIPTAIQLQLKKHATDGMHSEKEAGPKKGTIADIRKKYAERATMDSTEASAAIVLSHVEQFEEGWTKEQRRAAIESVAAAQLTHLLSLLDAVGGK